MNSNLKKYLNLKTVCIAMSFVLLYVTGVHRLAGSSLWYDETIEYFYSKYMFGEVPGGFGTHNMYERIVSTFQPPLYNFLMYFWLKISVTEWWFRFFGVVMGIVGAVGIFKAVEKLWNYKAACVCMIFVSCSYNFIYYMQECAEYTLIIATIGWLTYLWLNVIENFSSKTLFLFVFVSCIAVYSQYGAAFPVVAFSIMLIAYVIYKKNKRNLILIFSYYLGALLFFALPLWLFFLRKQLVNQKEYFSRNSEQFQLGNIDNGLDVTSNVFSDLFSNFSTIANSQFWTQITISYGTGYLYVCALLLLLATIVLVFSKKSIVKLLILANILCWLIYFIAVKANVYSYGVVSIRHSLFFLILWIPLLFIILHELIKLVEEKFNNSCYSQFIGGTLFGILVIIFLTNSFVIKNNWKKQDIRGVVQIWNEKDCYKYPTMLWTGAESGFYYYAKELYKYPSDKFNNVFMLRVPTKSEEALNYFYETFNHQWPQQIYLIASHFEDTDPSFRIIYDSLHNKGYSNEDLYNKDGGKLVLFKR